MKSQHGRTYALPCGAHHSPVPRPTTARTRRRSTPTRWSQSPTASPWTRLPGSSTSRPTRCRRRARRSTPSTSTPCPTATPAPTCSSPSRPPATSCGAARAADPDLGLEEGMALLARAALMGARGNSGVILSQMLRAYVTHLAAADGERAARADHRRGDVVGHRRQLRRRRHAGRGHDPHRRPGRLRRGARQPPRAATRAPATCSPPPPRPRAWRCRRTPEQLDVLAQAGVVDAGGRGLTVVLDAVETTATGRRPMPYASPIGTHHIRVSDRGARATTSPRTGRATR